MKRTLSLILVLALVAALFAGCASATGTYTLKSIGGKTPLGYVAAQYGMTEQELKDLAAQRGMDMTFTMSITLNKDGTCVLKTNIMGEVDTETGSWKQSGSSITMTYSDGKSDTMTLKNGQLTGVLTELDNATVVFSK